MTTMRENGFDQLFSLFTSRAVTHFSPFTIFCLFIDKVVCSNASSTVGLSASSTSIGTFSRDPRIAAFII